MERKHSARIIVASGTIFILLLKTFIRPQFAGQHGVENYFMGITPNLLGSFLLTIGLFMFPKNLGHTYNYVSLLWFSACCFLLLCFNETLQLIPIFNRTFDWNDIAASFVGLMLSLLFTKAFLIPDQQTEISAA